MAEETSLKDKAGKDFTVYIDKPDNGEIKGGLIVIHEVWGLNDHTKDVASRLANEGFYTLAPELLGDTGILNHRSEFKSIQEQMFNPERASAIQPKLRQMMAPIRQPGFAEATLDKLRACFDYMASQPETGGRVAVTGFCFGGSYSFSLAIDQPKLRAAAPFYGHCDQPVNQLSQIKCPIMAFYGERDQNLMTALPDLVERMGQAKVQFNYVTYPGAGHAFLNDTNPYAYNKEAATDAWEKLVHFLDANIK